MSKINSILNERLKKPAGQAKMAALAKKSTEGALSGFSGIFRLSELSETEKDCLRQILQNYALSERDVQQDLRLLFDITSEVKAITNQAAILHGERIKRAQNILKNYREGAFSAWLMATYGNRQTPYNFLQYYEFYALMPQNLHPLIENMPRQAVYTLASREGPLKQKEEIVRNSAGCTKNELLGVIRQAFPLSNCDKRAGQPHKQIEACLERLIQQISKWQQSLTREQREGLVQEMKKIQGMLTPTE